jgi:hypothetical protein
MSALKFIVYIIAISCLGWVTVADVTGLFFNRPNVHPLAEAVCVLCMIYFLCLIITALWGMRL